jgi:MFS family permease
MKIAADYYTKGLGKSLGFLVGALVVGTAFPHIVKSLSGGLPWKAVLVSTSGLALLGGSLMLLLVPDGPNRKPGQRLDLSAFFRVFKNSHFRSAAFGYFGHMWELYAFWAFVPVILQTYNLLHPGAGFNVPVWSFVIIGIGGLACVIGGYISLNFGTKRTAFTALLLSCICCLISPWIFGLNSSWLFLAFLLFWGMAVIADSPLFSTLVANNASLEIKGTALTIVNCIGFSITIFSIQLLNYLQSSMNINYIFTFLAIGPVLGLIALGTKTKTISVDAKK